MQLAPPAAPNVAPPSPGIIPTETLIRVSIDKLGAAQGGCADMLNDRTFSTPVARTALEQITQGVSALGSIVPGSAGFTDIGFAKEQALVAASKLGMAISAGQNWGGTGSPNDAQLKVTNDAFKALDLALEALSND